MLFHGRKCSFRGIPSFTEESILKLGTERNYAKKISFTNPASKLIFSHTFLKFSAAHFENVIQKERFLFQQTEMRACFLPRNARNKIPKVCFYSIFVPPNGIPNCFLFHGMVRNGISRVSCSSEQPEFRSIFYGIIFCRKFPSLTYPHRTERRKIL